jgi:hypothetical protein
LYVKRDDELTALNTFYTRSTNQLGVPLYCCRDCASNGQMLLQ